MSTTARVILAASFASPLLEVLGALPFFVHLWGVDSGTGKTVALMLAASVWGDPAVGAYIKTFDATVVGHEKTAAFLNHLPLCLDELQSLPPRGAWIEICSCCVFPAEAGVAPPTGSVD